MEYRDVARDFAALDARFHAAAAAAQPKLTAACDAAARTRAIVGERTHVCLEQQAAVARLQTLAQRGSVSLQYEDDQAGTRAERLRCASPLFENHNSS